jgi:filamentous hemagglutinin
MHPQSAMKQFTRFFTALFLCQTLALPAQATLDAGVYKPNSSVALAERAQTAINSGVISKSDGFAEQRLGGNQIQLTASQTLDNHGGVIQGTGQNSAISLNARDIVLRTSTMGTTSAIEGPNGTSTGTRVSAERIATLSADSITLAARNNITLSGARVQATKDLSLSAGADITVQAVQTGYTLNVPVGGNADGRSGYYRLDAATQQLSSLKAGNNLTVSAGGNASFKGTNAEAGQDLSINARNITIEAAKERLAIDQQGILQNGYIRAASTDETLVGANFTAGNNLTLTASGDKAQDQGNITLTAAQLNAQGGQTRLLAGNNVLIQNATTQHSSELQNVDNSSSLFSGSTSRLDSNSQSSAVQGSSVQGNTVLISAGNDIQVKGSSVVSDADTTLLAKRDITIEAASSSQSGSHYEQKTESGFLSGGGFGITFGNRDQSLDGKNTATQAVASTVGSIGGNVTVVAGNNYTQTGSEVMTPAGDITILAKTVNIQEARETGNSQSEQKFSQSGLTLALTSPVITAVQSVQGMVQATSQTKDNRMQALGAASAALSAKSAIDGIASASAAMDAGQSPAQASGINVSLSIGASSSQSNSVQTSNIAAASTVQAGGNVNISATGAGKDSALTIQGSSVKAGNDVTLKADGDINLLAAKNTQEQHSTDKSSSASVGIGFALGGSQNGFTLNIGASGSRGKADGNDLGYSNTLVQAGKQLTLQSGGDTTLKGAVASGKQVVADVAGNLNIESLSDTSTYVSKQQSLGGSLSLCIPPFCYGASSGSVSASKSNVDGNFASVTEQSGLKAGDGGFQVNVKGNTDLKGGAITSSDKAVTDNKNTFTTASLTQSDIQNQADASASSSGINLSSDMSSQGNYGLAKAALGNALNNAGESGSSSGQTRSAVSAGSVTITDDAKQQQLTGKTGQETVASLNRDTTHAQTAAQKQDVQAMLQTVEAERAIKQAVVAEAVKFSDEAYRKIFVEKHPMYEVVKDKDGNTQFDEKTGRPILRELSEQEKTNLQVGSDGKIHISTNGIFNGKDAAGTYANQHSNTSGPQYVIYFPEANNVVSELMVAGYQKFLENDFMGLSNSTVQVKNSMNQYGQTGLQLDGHSRGAMTIGNGLESKAQDPAASGSLSATTIHFFGPAYNAQQADDLLSTLQDRPNLPEVQQPGAILQFQNHAADPVGGLIGRNPSTGGTIPESSSTAIEAIRAGTGRTTTVHNCYGLGPTQCQQFWQDSPKQQPLLIPVQRGSIQK